MITYDFFGRRALRIAVGIMMLGLLLVGGAGAETITVNASGDGDSMGIRDIINSSIAGETIEVQTGSYFDNLIVNKQPKPRGIVIPIVDAGRSGSTITVATNRTILEGFTSSGAGAENSYEFVLKIPFSQQWLFNSPSGVAVDSSGNVYVADTDNNRIQKFSSSGVFLSKWGSLGSDDGQFSYPRGIAVDSSGNVYIADTDNNRIQKFSSSGVFLSKWGSLGSGDGQFSLPMGIAIDSSGNVYVADSVNTRIQKFSSSGVFLSKWGSSGTGDGQFNYPSGIAVDSSGNIYVADSVNTRIQKFSSSGVFLSKWGSSGIGDGQFSFLSGIAVDSSGNVYVAETNNPRIQKFSSSGVFLSKWGSSGIGDGQFNYPSGIAVDSSGNVYVADTYNDRIQKFSSSGVFLSKWGSSGIGDGQFSLPMGIAIDSSGNVYVADTYNNRIQKFSSSGVFLSKWGSSGIGDGKFYWPRGVAADNSGNIYVAEYSNFRIQKFNSSGVFLSKWGSSGNGDGQFKPLSGVAVDSSGNVYVADTYNNRIQKFSSSGVFLSKWERPGNGDGQFNCPYGIAVGSSGNVYVADTDNNRIQKFSSSGVFLSKWGSYGNGDGQFKAPFGITVDSSDNVYISDLRNHRIQKFTVSQGFRFVQITDVHIGQDIEECFDYKIPIKERVKKCGRLRLQSVEKFSVVIEKIKADNPDFVLVTGDIVEWNNPFLYQDFNNQIARLKKDVYVVPGNHDRRGIEKPLDKFDAVLPCADPCMENYIEYIGSRAVSGVSGDYLNGNNYYFDKFGYRFIGLDSGYDPFWEVPFDYDLTIKPTGSGLSVDQIKFVNDNIKDDKTIIFMHHPAINKIDTDGNRYNVIEENRQTFIGLMKNRNVKLVLTGHTHFSKIYQNSNLFTDYNPWCDWDPFSPDSLCEFNIDVSTYFNLKRPMQFDSPLFVQTSSATKGDSTGYLIVDVGQDGDKEMLIRDIKMSGTESKPGKILSVFSPADLHVYDEFGRHTGINGSGGIDNQIPDSYYFEELNIGNSTLPASIILYNNTLNYRSEIVSNFSKENITTEQSHFNFTIEERTGETIKTISYDNVTIEENSRAYIEVNSSQTNSMQVDLNNDGTNETVKTPDSVMTDYAPIAAITSPPNGSVWDQGQAITFGGIGSDSEDGALIELAWMSDRDAVIGHGNFITSNLSAGTHRITLRVNDSIGQVNISSIVLAVKDTMPPNLEIDYPMENKTFNNPNVNVKGIAYDDSGISNVTVNGIQAGKESWNASLGLSEGENRIEVVATDNKGFNKTANRTVYYNSSLGSDTQPPAAITNLTHRSGYDNINGAWINWTWDNPKDEDFSYAIVYLDNIPMGNTSRSYFNSTGLSNDAYYNLSVLTADIVDNINFIIVNATARTASNITNPSITVVSPNGGENWTRGTTQMINWTSTGSNKSYVKIELLKPGVANKVIIASTLNDGSHPLLIPVTLVPGTDYKIKITNTTNAAYNDTSDKSFTIPNPTINVVSPNGTESWIRGTTQIIKWNSTGSPGSYVKIEILKAGILKSNIIASTLNDGSHPGLIPALLAPGTDYKVKITSTANASYNDTSDNSFTIPVPSFKVVSPNGSENWTRGTTQTIRWNSTENPKSYVKIELLKAGILNKTIIASTPNDGTHPWLILATQAPGTDYKIRITSTANASCNDTSNANFTIPTPSITVVSPNGSENWTRGTTQTIKWNSSGSPGAYVKIELMKAGVANRVIIASTLNDGSHPWLIPPTQAPGTDYKVRITSTTNASYNDTSDNSFTIPAPSFTVVSPNGSDSWIRGTTKTIRWNSTESPGSYVKIELLKPGVPNKVIIASTLNDGSHPWLISAAQTPGNDYNVKITSTINVSNNDTSDNTFTIPAPSFSVVSPNGSENWTRGTIQTIRWNSTESPGTYVKIELLKPGVANKVLIASTLNDGSHPWLIPATQTPGADYKIKVTSTANVSNNDTTDKYFSIIPPKITVTFPNGGENWTRGTAYAITWNYTGNPGAYVKIELLKNGVVNRTILTSTPNDKSQSWIIPTGQALGADYRVRVTSTTNVAYNDTSDRNFNISSI